MTESPRASSGFRGTYERSDIALPSLAGSSAFSPDPENRMNASKATKGGTNKLQITMQYRGKRGRVYELKHGESQLALHIFPPELEADSGKWRVEAREGVQQGTASVDGWGISASEALRDVARVWMSQSPALVSFNWDAVAHELQLVQAL
jgi:hypothetical protein